MTEVAETDQERVDRSIVYYKEGKYDLFLSIAEQLLEENKIVEFICQALSNVYFTNKEYEKALNVNTICTNSFHTKDNLDNRLKILEKLGDTYNDEKGTTLIRLYTLTSDNIYIQAYIELKIVLPSSFLTVFELVRKIKPMFFTNIIFMFFKKQPYGYLLYGKDLLFKALEMDETTTDNDIIERCNKSNDADEKYACLLYLLLPKLFYMPEEVDLTYQRILSNLKKIQTLF
jgi:tetratricopeptide (TPR) repeat protein